MDILASLGIDTSEVRRCPDCGAEMRVAAETDSVRHTHGGAIEIFATIPIWTCTICGSAWKDGRGELVEKEAVKSFLRRRLSPDEVRSIRKSFGLSQVKFGQLTGFGHKSIGRWERGLLMQNASADSFLRLLAHREVAQLLLRQHKEIEEAKKR